MTAGVLERAQHAVVITDNQDSVWAATVFEVVARLGNVVDHAGDLPHLRPHPLDLQRSERRRVIALGRHQGRGVGRGADRVLLDIRAGAGRVAGGSFIGARRFWDGQALTRSAHQAARSAPVSTSLRRVTVPLTIVAS